ncbi:ATP adenylyltransferase [Verrucomicrobium sp. GAS474]|nr:ATP adenylyltransferase [Verrucomicrobium sp. GAS474]
MSAMEHLWAPWRKAYVQDAATPRGEIFLRLGQAPEADDEANGIVLRGKGFYAVLNRFPYNTAHTLVVPYRVVSTLEELSEDEQMEGLRLLLRLKAAITAAFHPQGFNIGVNLGAAAGAGIEAHLHWHIVPRWGGDSNFMTSVGDTRVHPNDLAAVWKLLKTELGK